MLKSNNKPNMFFFFLIVTVLKHIYQGQVGSNQYKLRILEKIKEKKS